MPILKIYVTVVKYCICYSISSFLHEYARFRFESAYLNIAILKKVAYSHCVKPIHIA
jgi:hypothetical protein